MIVYQVEISPTGLSQHPELLRICDEILNEANHPQRSKRPLLDFVRPNIQFLGMNTVGEELSTVETALRSRFRGEVADFFIHAGGQSFPLSLAIMVTLNIDLSMKDGRRYTFNSAPQNRALWVEEQSNKHHMYMQFSYGLSSQDPMTMESECTWQALPVDGSMLVSLNEQQAIAFTLDRQTVSISAASTDTDVQVLEFENLPGFQPLAYMHAKITLTADDAGQIGVSFSHLRLFLTQPNLRIQSSFLDPRQEPGEWTKVGALKNEFFEIKVITQERLIHEDVLWNELVNQEIPLKQRAENEAQLAQRKKTPSLMDTFASYFSVENWKNYLYPKQEEQNKANVLLFNKIALEEDTSEDKADSDPSCNQKRREIYHP